MGPPRQDRLLRRLVFRRGQYVRSYLFGLGQVLADDEAVLVRFLGGRECRVPAESLTVVPEEVFETEIANRSVIEARLLIHVYGPEALDPSGRLWVRDPDGLWTTVDKLREESTWPPGGFEFSAHDDVDADARFANTGDL